MKKYLSVCIFFVLFFAQASAKNVTIATVDWEPYTGSKLKNDGFATEIVKKAFELKGYQVVVKYLPWARGLKEVEKGKLDILFPAYKTKERTEKYILSAPFITGNSSLFHNVNKRINWTTMNDLVPYKIGVIRGYSNGPLLDNAKNLKKEAVSSLGSNIKKLGKGKIDLFADDLMVVKHYLNNKFSKYKNTIEKSGKSIAINPMHLLISKGLKNSKNLKEDFDSGLMLLKKNGGYEKIMKSHGF